MGIPDSIEEREAIAALQKIQLPRVKRFVEGAPKVELHSHLGGSVDPTIAFDYLRDAGGNMHFHDQTFGSAQELDAFLRRPVQNLAEYLDKYNATRAVFSNLDNLSPLIDNMAGKYAAENTKILEIRTSLKSLDTNSGADSFPAYSPDQEMEAYKQAVMDAREKYNMVINLIFCIRRGRGEEHKKMAWRTLGYAIEGSQEDGLVKGLDLAGKEDGNPADYFAPMFLAAKHNNLGTTIHAGEAFDERSIKSAIDLVDRLGHITSLTRHTPTYEKAREEQITGEICLTSNLECHALCHTPTGEKPIETLDDHPFPLFYRDGINTAICVDNLVVSNTTLNKELMLLYTEFGLSVNHIANIIRNSINASFSTRDEKRAVNRELDFWTDKHRR